MSKRSKLWDRVRFQVNARDYRPVNFPPPGPYWCTGYGYSQTHPQKNVAIIVAYFRHGASDSEIKTFWPEAESIDLLSVGVPIEFEERFPAPDWWNEARDRHAIGLDRKTLFDWLWAAFLLLLAAAAAIWTLTR